LAACGGGAADSPQSPEQSSEPSSAESAGSNTADAGTQPEGYAESPMLAELVASGSLPPVEERLPKDVAVVSPKTIGQFGGPLRLLGLLEGAGVFTQLTEDSQQGLLTIDPQYTEFQPNIAKRVELADDAMSLTIYLREGMKWSDGNDFTADDFAFWYNDILQDPDLTPEISTDYTPGGELMGLNVIDDFTVQFTFAAPYFRAIEVFAGPPTAKPEHFIKQYMPKYNDGAEALAQEEGYETWQQAVQYYTEFYNADPMAPTLNPWLVKEIGADSALWERNPYYWKVDTAGNQLPYADTLLVALAEDFSSTPIRVMSGDLDFADYTGLSVADYPVLKQNEEQGGFTVHLWPRTDVSFALGFALNYTHPDPVLNQIFNDLRFRQALSLAINREEINENILYGLTEPWTAPVSSAWTGFEEWMGTHYADYDVAQANALLDEMGLEWDAAHEFRLRPDGQPLTIIGQHTIDYLAYADEVLDLVSIHWKEIGVDFQPKFMPYDPWRAAALANETDMGIWSSDGGTEIMARARYPIRLMPPWHWTSCCPMSSIEWRNWLDSNGEEGIEPPDEVKHIYELVWEWLAAPHGSAEYEAKVKELIKLNVENLYFFGTTSSPPAVFVYGNRLGNAPEEGAVVGWGILAPYMVDTFFIRQ
jgi:peptide/nickel transport system substrate-binding protein